ncbi:LacI family DNA-binding transcriptional regulator [Streptomyces silvisoli]|uniref:LacI family DNA-binding transcriptional regulator n=1 Tax=Streptomyces silvisoli TaxID=3034235 RepID=A0ABT5ZUB0_9ACTN|nr:LacI family DNA-binding transcriptional regulator [Streptomyces silvisoli]MDF3293321.1 LacI family DNA-binding transcriptional regulator [Streptomyces silvisoli]
MTVTLADVAARAGVSSATVSRVLNGNYPVAGSTRARVLRAVEELEYVVNGQARGLAAATSDLVGVLVNDIADPFFGIMAGAAQAEIAHGSRGGTGTCGGKLAVVCNTGGCPEAELTYLTLLQRQRAAGVIVTGGAAEGTEHTQAVTAKLARLASDGTRVVLCGRPPLPLDGDAATLAFDNRGGARRLTGHLLELGHRHIGYITGPENRSTTRHRLEGHRAALADHGLAADAERLTVGGDFGRAAGYRGARELLDTVPELTAIVAANDTAALGVCAALRERGLRVPRDVSVAGFDDLPFSVDAAPALTTVRLPLHEAGARAGRLVMGRESAPPGGVSMVTARLVTRASTAPPPTS